jgi:hypothetical protein
MLKRGDLASGEKYAAKIKNPDYVHQLMVLMDEIKAKKSPPKEVRQKAKGERQK